MEGYKFKILHEEVAEEDHFTDLTHEKTAQNLYKIISSTERGVTIGLEGGWGYGKSTVVHFLRNKLANNKERTLFYLFDTWAHDGDPLRRIFLEGLIDNIDPEHSDPVLNDLTQEISGRKKTVEINIRKSTSKLGGWLSFSAIFVPIGAAILSAVDYTTLVFPSYSLSPHYLFLVGAVLSLAPLVALVGWFFFGEVDKNRPKGCMFSPKKWDIFESNAEETLTQNITEDGDRTSVEFERFFKRIMEHGIGENKPYQKAIIVIDNLDRIDRERAVAVWSVLQTFFQHRSSVSTSSWLSRLWFLVPHDKEGLSKIWSSEKNAESFLEKCFQLIEEVPEPVMTSWAEYCEKCVRESLTGWPELERNHVTETFKRFESRLDSSPTPRQIRSFVNRVGVLGMRRGGEVPSEVIALYALLRKDRSDKKLRQELLEQNLPNGYRGILSEKDLKSYLAGMLFGVDKDKGMQLLLGPEINSALRDGDAEKLAKIIDKEDKGFWMVWETIKSSCLPSTTHVEEYRVNMTHAFCCAMKPFL